MYNQILPACSGLKAACCISCTQAHAAGCHLYLNTSAGVAGLIRHFANADSVLVSNAVINSESASDPGQVTAIRTYSFSSRSSAGHVCHNVQLILHGSIEQWHAVCCYQHHPPLTVLQRRRLWYQS